MYGAAPLLVPPAQGGRGGGGGGGDGDGWGGRGSQNIIANVVLIGGLGLLMHFSGNNGGEGDVTPVCL